MLAVLRPALAVLLLVGVGVAAVESAERCCAAELGDSCALLEADDNDARVGGVAAAVPSAPGLTRIEQPPLCVDAAPAVPAARVADVLTAAPKTSPPA